MTKNDASTNVVVGKFSKNHGSKVRRIYDTEGNFLGTITKMESGGYRVYRQKDGKVREKPYLAEAKKTIARAN